MSGAVGTVSSLKALSVFFKMLFIYLQNKVILKYITSHSSICLRFLSPAPLGILFLVSFHFHFVHTSVGGVLQFHKLCFHSSFWQSESDLDP